MISLSHAEFHESVNNVVEMKDFFLTSDKCSFIGVDLLFEIFT